MPEITYATIQERWAEELAAIERAAFPTAGMVDLLSVEDIRILCGTFPEGGFVALDGDRPVGHGRGGSSSTSTSTSPTTAWTTLSGSTRAATTGPTPTGTTG
jgi:hypothetical protein